MEQVIKQTRELIDRARAAEKILSRADSKTRKNAICLIAEALIADKDVIFAENKRDLDAAKASGLRESMLDRLALNEARLIGMAQGANKVSSLPDPLGRGETWKHENGMEISRTRVPL